MQLETFKTGDHIALEGPDGDYFEGVILKDCDADDVIHLRCDDDGQRYRINGWDATYLSYNGVAL